MIGREPERQELGRRIAGLRTGASFALLVEGPPGIGKSTLLDDAVAGAGMASLRTQGYASEAEIPFGGLLGLLGPVLDRRDALADGPRRALEAALALAAPEPYDPFALRGAVAGLLAGAAEDGPLLVVVDDAHWLDEDSREALLFAARRLDGAGVGLLLAARDADGAPVAGEGLGRIVLGGLDDDSALALLAGDAPAADPRGVTSAAAPTDPAAIPLAPADAAAPTDASSVPLAPAVAEAVLRASAGNPLALRELPRALTAGQRAGAEPLGQPLAAAGPLAEAFDRRLDALDPDTQLALCVVAALGGGRREQLDAALTDLGLDGAVLRTPAARDLLTFGERVTLRHPLLASAAYHGRPSAQRRAVHRALAAVSTDASRRAWHVSQAAVGPDESVAALVETAGLDARARGAHAESARTFARAAELSPDAAAAAGRLLAAAQDFAVAGHGPRALIVAEQLIAGAGALGDRDGTAPGELLTTAQHLRAHLLMRGGDPATALEVLEELAAGAAASGDRPAAAQLLLEASMTHMFGGDMQALLDSAQRAREQSAGVSPELELVATLVSGEALVALGRAAEGDALIAASQVLLDTADALSPIAEVIGMGAMASMWIERFDRAQAALDRLVDGGRAAGAAGRLPYPLGVRSQLRWRRGRWPAARADAEEAVRLARDTGQDGMLAVVLPALARCEAGAGHLDAARALAREGIAVGEAAAGDATVVHSLAALGFTELTAGRPADAVAPLERAAELTARLHHGEPALTLFAADRVEALARADRRDDADAALAALAEAALRTGGGWAAAVTERGRVLLAAPEELDAHAAAALLAHERVAMPFERARTQLAIGERLRRDRRRGDARDPLTAALATFERLGAEPWAQRARQELHAAGAAEAETVPAARADAETVAELTPHELQIALLVADGRSNRDAAAALFLSPKTIEHHLSAIYRKLGLRSRTQLAALLAEES